MLVLTRKSMESIRVSDNVVITVLEIRGNTVRLGIEAPRAVPIYRTELYEARSTSPGDSVPKEVSPVE